MKTDIITIMTYNNIKYVSIPDLINYLDNTAIEFEKVKDNYGVELLNKLADALNNT